MKVYKFLDGSIVNAEKNICRGCYLEKHSEKLSSLIQPVIQNKHIAVRQDAEFPVPGFYIIGFRKHINTIIDVSDEVACQMQITIKYVRKAMKEELNINKAHTYLEERLVEPHYHVWLLPLWENIMKANNINPKIWNNNILEYLNLFDYESNKNTILKYNKIMKEILSTYEPLVNFNFKLI